MIIKSLFCDYELKIVSVFGCANPTMTALTRLNRDQLSIMRSQAENWNQDGGTNPDGIWFN